MSEGSLSAINDSLDTGMIIVTTALGSEQAGCLVGFHSQSSMDPERYCVWLSKANYTYRLALHSTHLGIHFLTASDLELARRFGTVSGDTTDKFADLDLGQGTGGVPVLSQCDHRMIGRRVGLLDDGGDHVCVITHPVTVTGSGAFEPLRLSDVADLRPGHDNKERPVPPTERANPGGT
jgi:flavin reductase (DIM6/NTAB) family NADH-FMN oxidoreductase RutF